MFNYVNIIYLVYINLYIILEPGGGGGGGGKHDSVNRIILPKKKSVFGLLFTHMDWLVPKPICKIVISYSSQILPF